MPFDVSAPTSISCVVADDHPAVLDSVARYLAAHEITIAATATSGDEALQKVERCRPTLAVLDYQMPGTHGAQLVARARELSPETRIAVYTGSIARGPVSESLDAGASAVVYKDAPLADLVRALRVIGGGGTYVDPAAGGALTAARVQLTGRERQILRLLADGRTYDDVGAELFISGETVRAHLNRAREKLGAKTRTQAVVAAVRLELIA